MTVTLEGFSELDKALEDLTKATGRGVLRRSLKNAAEPMAEIARNLAPDDPATTGFDLKKSIKYGTVLSHLRVSEIPDSDYANSRTGVSVIPGQFGHG